MAPGVGEPAHLCSAVPTGVMAPGAGDPIILEFAVVFHSSPGFGAKAQLGRQTHATRETVTMAALKLDYSVLDAPQRATDRIEADL